MAKFETYKDVKIAVYAICKNEAKFIEGWLRNMWCDGKGADGVYVLDTGSTDTTLQDFESVSKAIGAPEDWLTVKQKAYEKWRFDTGRNDNLAMVPPEKYDVFYCIDLDEKVIPDFWDDLRKMVFEHPDFERIYYQYAWSHDEETGAPKWYFWYDKIHGSRGWRWGYPVHEWLKCDKPEKYGYKGTYRLDANKIYLHHYPDPTKSRGSYLGLLKLRAEEYPDDLYGLYYLAREYSFHNEYQNALKAALELYVRLLKGDPTKEELSARDDMNMLPGTCCMLGDMFWKCGLKDDAEFYYSRAIRYNDTIRDGYIKLAQLLAYRGRSEECYAVLRDMNNKTVKTTDWRSVDYYWRDWKKYQIIADAKCWEGKYEEAQKYFDMAFADIKTVSDKSDAKNKGLYMDYAWLVDHLAKQKK